ncbi:MaoC family dehydratase [Solicola gregarius]|uniref:MaoC family dehydratase n=1 Tax=Solicola gregarius TaxID=2908642 RepID=A0AA46TF78_9ACTN|nr:MaoC family dehydratase [Solicola gregarius]UYM03707.1 MaoC family dehydratase [Solicola gregarius]
MSLEPGSELGPLAYPITRADLVRYAGASGDFNPIHWSDRVAMSVGLPGVLAHGMYTMALAGRAVESWLDDGQQVVEFAVRFTKPVLVPDDEAGTQIEVSGLVKDVTDGRTRIDLTVRCGEEKVLGMARAFVA